ncbi:MAG: ketoacyl-ACP synthase III [Lentisphaeria bacterium]|nr:ketoacyl-ACP synthase III [Lentisphaeria bacterium]MBR7127262.1 ketoacyl-ACP synthase III [Lentisphaeria bacterium]
MGIIIKGTGSYVPEKILTNKDLEAMVDTNDEWITTRTGIKERHIASAEQATSDLAYQAALKALAAANITAEDLDVIIIATVTPDKFFPNTACFLQQKLGAKNAFCFDIEAACSGLLYSLEVANSLLSANKKYKNALVIGAEKLSCITNWEDRNTCVLFGDGAGAVVLGKDDNFDYNSVVATDLHADGTYTDLLQIPAGGSRTPQTAETLAQGMQYTHMQGREVFKLAVGGMVGASKKVLEDANLEASQLKKFIPHQANLRIIEAVAQRLDVDDDLVYKNVFRYGNTSASSIGLCLDELNSAGELKRGDYVLLTAFGSGLTWGAVLLKW